MFLDIHTYLTKKEEHNKGFKLNLKGTNFV